jgi:hypothetical protein
MKDAHVWSSRATEFDFLCFVILIMVNGEIVGSILFPVERVPPKSKTKGYSRRPNHQALVTYQSASEVAAEGRSKVLVDWLIVNDPVPGCGFARRPKAYQNGHLDVVINLECRIWHSRLSTEQPVSPFIVCQHYGVLDTRRQNWWRTCWWLVH